MANITFNGKTKSIEENISISDYIVTNNYKPNQVVVELNEVIIPSEKYEETILKEGDVLEVLSFMGGGA